MKIYMQTDLEGVAGVVSFEAQAYETGRYYEAARKLLTAEVNAAIDGLLEGGADEVIVDDMHGPGAIVFEDLHPAARLLHGRPLASAPRRDAVIEACQAMVIVGQHSMAGTDPGNLNHTQSSRTIDSYRLNGRAIGEMAQLALYYGAVGIPLIFLTGDDAACREAEELVPGIVTVATKQSLSRSSALTLSAQRSRQLIRQGAQQAITRHRAAPLKPVRWPGPYVLEKRYFHTDVADRAAAWPGAVRIDSQTVRVESQNIRDIIYT